MKFSCLDCFILCYLPTHTLLCVLVQYTDNSIATLTIKMAPLKDDRITAADEMNVDLTRICFWGQIRILILSLLNVTCNCFGCYLI